MGFDFNGGLMLRYAVCKYIVCDYVDWIHLAERNRGQGWDDMDWINLAVDRNQCCEDVDWIHVFDFRDYWCDDMDWIQLAEDKYQWCNDVDWINLAVDRNQCCEDVDWIHVFDFRDYWCDDMDWIQLAEDRLRIRTTGDMLTQFIWLRTGNTGCLLWTREWTLGFHEGWGMYCPVGWQFSFHGISRLLLFILPHTLSIVAS
jgi:hypothetical protein